MLEMGQLEVDAVAKALLGGQPFRYLQGSQCGLFEERYAKFLGVKHVHMTASGTNALTAALIGLGIGPGAEVLVPACTYMASAIAVVAAGAIPVIVDIDDSIGMDPKAAEAAIGPLTRAIMPVHMWGQPCDMDAIMAVAKRHQVLVLEDACQGVGGGYKGRKLGAIGHAGAFSFNYYKNMTAGEGGAVVTNDEAVIRRAKCVVDCCSFYWNSKDAQEHFCASGARATEIAGAILNVQLDRISGLLGRLRRIKKRVLREGAALGLRPVRANSLDDECATCAMFMFDEPAVAEKFAAVAGGCVTANTGRHVYTEWFPILHQVGAHHPALDPFKLAENRKCRMNYAPDVCQKSLDIMRRTVMVGLSPAADYAAVTKLIRRLRQGARECGVA